MGCDSASRLTITKTYSSVAFKNYLKRMYRRAPMIDRRSTRHAAGRVGKRLMGLQRCRLNLKHLTLPEIKYFKALGDRFCFRVKAKHFGEKGGRLL
jgi:hypothetical protein